MNIERFSLALRRRRAWEAFDLGLMVARQWRKPALIAWGSVYLSVALIASGVMVLCDLPLTLAAVALWWLKPAFDRVLLFVFSRAVFGEVPTLRETMRALPQLWWRWRLLSDLTLRRLSPARSFLLPISQLEGQRGKAWHKRERVLSSGAYGYASWLTIICAHFVAALQLLAQFLAYLLHPVASGASGSGGMAALVHFFSEPSGPVTALFVMASVALAEILVEPYYVAAGFSLYLNRRSELEGWDLELAFRRMSLRLQGLRRVQAAPLAMTALAAAIFLGLGAMTPQAVHAAEPATTTEASPTSAAQAAPTGKPPSAPELKRIDGSDNASDVIDKVLEDKVFGSAKEGTTWKYVGGAKDDKIDRQDQFRWLADLALLFGRGARVLVYVLGVVLLTWVIILVVRYRDRTRGARKGRAAAPDFLFGLDVRPESLPSDIAGAARSALAAGDVARALSLLYRAALADLIHRAGLDFKSGDTEGNCAARVRRRMPAALSQYFASLLDARLKTVYAHRPPAQQALLDLCDAWPKFFGPTADLTPAETGGAA